MAHEEQVQVQRQCDVCGGAGIVGIVSKDMARDAGDMAMEGYEVPCNQCGGQGWVIDVDVVMVDD